MLIEKILLLISLFQIAILEKKGWLSIQKLRLSYQY